MIFSVGQHIELIIKGEKTQTRRSSNRYEIDKLYSIQPSRTSKGISEGKIKIVDKSCEFHPCRINHDDAKAEGGYLPNDFEKLYAELHPNWAFRYAYVFRFVPTKKEV